MQRRDQNFLDVLMLNIETASHMKYQITSLVHLLARSKLHINLMETQRSHPKTFKDQQRDQRKTKTATSESSLGVYKNTKLSYKLHLTIDCKLWKKMLPDFKRL